jgi:four helix bundle protein
VIGKINESVNLKMENDKSKFKKEFKARLYNWVLRLIKFIDTLPKDTTSQVISKQLIRSGTSVLANYVEADSASSKKDFINFFTHSLKSANESKVWLTLLRDTEKGHSEENGRLITELVEVSNIIASSILTLKGRK